MVGRKRLVLIQLFLTKEEFKDVAKVYLDLKDKTPVVKALSEKELETLVK